MKGTCRTCITSLKNVWTTEKSIEKPKSIDCILDTFSGFVKRYLLFLDKELRLKFLKEKKSREIVEAGIHLNSMNLVLQDTVW